MRRAASRAIRLIGCAHPRIAYNLLTVLPRTTYKYTARLAPVFNKHQMLIETDAPDDVLLVFAGGYPGVTCPTLQSSWDRNHGNEPESLYRSEEINQQKRG